MNSGNSEARKICSGKKMCKIGSTLTMAWVSDANVSKLREKEIQRPRLTLFYLNICVHIHSATENEVMCNWDAGLLHMPLKSMQLLNRLALYNETGCMEISTFNLFLALETDHYTDLKDYNNYQQFHLGS